MRPFPHAAMAIVSKQVPCGLRTTRWRCNRARAELSSAGSWELWTVYLKPGYSDLMLILPSEASQKIENGIREYRGMPGKVTYFSHIGSACTLHPPPASHWFLGKGSIVFYPNTEEGARITLSSESAPLHLYKLMGVVMQKYAPTVQLYEIPLLQSPLMPAQNREAKY